jgi:general secretion pathway protein I
MCRHAGGFSLLEMLVAMAILGVTLGALYQAVSGATRNTRSGERYAYGVELARSLLADNAVVPGEGLLAEGETSGEFRWQVRTQAINTGDRGNAATSLPLHSIAVMVSWQDGTRRRQVVLNSVVEARRQ